MRRSAPLVGVALAAAVLLNCGGSSPQDATITATPAPATATPAPPTPTPGTPIPFPTAEPPADAQPQPLGFPLDPSFVLGRVVGAVGERLIEWDAGPTVEAYSREHQPSEDPVAANASGWNCRSHQEYEARPAADWYVPVGTPVYATMDGVAALWVISTSNPFDVYEVSREPYLGNPDRARASVSPFPGPGGGKGLFVRVENGQFATEYAHLEPELTSAIVPLDAWEWPYSADTDLHEEFGELRDFLSWTLLAEWYVRQGDLVGYTGDTGYSEAPHLHYTVARQGGDLLCPTTEPGFPDGGWLVR